MQILLPSNVTSVILASVEMTWLFSVAGNTADGSTGLTSSWLCKYDYHAVPSEPQLLSIDSLSADSIIIRWTPLQCDADNRARVLHYVVHCINNETGILYCIQGAYSSGKPRKLREF